MAYAVTDLVTPGTDEDQPSWRAQDVSVGDVLKAIDNLRRNELRAATRTSVATLVIVTRSTDEVDDAETVIDHLGVRHPARIINILAPPDARRSESRVDADVTLHTGTAAGHSIWSDEIRLRVSGGPARHTASLLRPMLLSDLPVVAWYVRGIPSESDPILKIATGIVVDSKVVSGTGEGEPAMRHNFDSISLLCRKNVIVDLSWNRLRPWRRLLAAQFEGSSVRPFLNGIKSAEITGKLGPRTLLAGWLSSRLRLDREQLHLYDGRHVSIRIEAELDGVQAQFEVSRIEGQRLIRASTRVQNGPQHEELIGLPSDALPISLSDALRNLGRDRVYEQSIKLVAGWQ
jgi:glucose-6-phosphate dehydrogenase assembly protein OpcA